MSSVVLSVLKMTLGLYINKVRISLSESLKDGDLNSQQFRSLKPVFHLANLFARTEKKVGTVPTCSRRIFSPTNVNQSRCRILVFASRRANKFAKWKTGFIVSDMESVKAKIDGLARSKLLSSASFIQEGMVLLNDMLDKSRTATGFKTMAARPEFDLPMAGIFRHVVHFKNWLSR